MRHDRLLKNLIRERFVVTLKTGETFDGLLDEWDERTLQLVDPHAVTEKGPVPVDGKLYLPRDQIAYMQKPA